MKRAGLLRRGLSLMVVFTQVFAGTGVAAQSKLKGKVIVDGSSTVFPITEAAAHDFGKEFPNVSVTVAISGTGGGFKRFVKGETDISNASRPIKPEEFQKAKENGVQFIELPVALDGLSVVVSPENDWIQEISIPVLQAIYIEGGKVRKWSDVNTAWPNETIKVYSPGTDSGTFDYFKEVVVPKEKSFRADMSTSEDDNVLVTGVSGDKYAIGYFGASYYFENKDKLKAVAVVNPKTRKAMLPEPENVISGEYAPLSRPLFIYVNANSLRRPEVKQFVDHYINNAARFATQVQYVAIPESVASTAKMFLQNKVLGSTYVTPDNKKREGRLIEVYNVKNVTK
jgi:phosphate transport system substrate-binding protein